MKKRKGIILKAEDSRVVLSTWREEPVREGGIKDAKGGEMSRRAEGGYVPGGGGRQPRGDVQGAGLVVRGRNPDFGERCELGEKASGKLPFFPSVPNPGFPQQAGVFTREKTCFPIMQN